MKPTTIFISYNPNDETEQTIAARLHTIGAVNGFRMYLPDRYNSDTLIDEETKRRISLSDYFVVFSLGNLSNIVKQEIEYSFEYLQDKSRILVIYDSSKGKNLKGETTIHFTPFYFDPIKNSQEVLLTEIINTISIKQRDEKIKKLRTQIKIRENETENYKAIAAILGIGLGLVVLGALFSGKK
ncbi:MAG: hypothetical protein HY738_21485 [Bacteroidia bacterium]|nr:hypothetical protein [Bacteroidia bacterium]